MNDIALWIIVALLAVAVLLMIINIIYVFKAGFASCVSMLGLVIFVSVSNKLVLNGSISLGGYLNAEGGFIPMGDGLAIESLQVFMIGALVGMVICLIGILGSDYKKTQSG